MTDLQKYLGQMYFLPLAGAPPLFLQIVGWTKTAEKPETKHRYVYVRRVPLTVRHNPGVGTGSWDFDWNVINKYSSDLLKPIHHCTTQTFSALLVPGGDYLRYNKCTIPKFIPEK